MKYVKLRHFYALLFFILLGVIAWLAISKQYERYSRYSKLLSQWRCNLSDNSLINKYSCHLNALGAFYSGKDEDASLSVLTYLCDNGLSKSCVAIDFLNRLSKDLGFARYYTNASKIINNCFNTDEIQKEYYCLKAFRIGFNANDYHLVSDLTQMNCDKDSKECEKHVFQNIISTPEEIALLKRKYCFKESTYCQNLSKVEKLNKSLNETFNDKLPKVYERLLSIKNQMCSLSHNDCMSMVNSDQFIKKIIEKFPKNLPTTQLFKDFDGLIRVENQIMIWEELKPAMNFQEQDFVNLHPTQYITYNYFKKEKDVILNYCNSIKDKTGCFLAFFTLSDVGDSGKELLAKWCSENETDSCHILNLIQSDIFQGADQNMSLLSLKYGVDHFIFQEIINHPTYKIRVLINSYKYHLLALLILSLISLQFYILWLIKRSESIFGYIREEKLNKIKEKITKIE